MPNAVRTFAHRGPAGGRNPLAATQSGSLHAGKLLSGKKVCKNLIFKTITINSSSMQMDTGIERVGGGGGQE